MPSTALIAVQKLRAIAAALEAGRAPDPGDGAWLASRVRRYLDGAERGLLTIDLAFGLAPGPGGVTWFEAERRDQRDSLLRDMAVRHFPGQRPGPAAKAIEAAWRRYVRNRLASDRRRGESGAAPGSIEADLFELGRLDGPPGHKQVRNIIAGVADRDAA